MYEDFSNCMSNIGCCYINYISTFKDLMDDSLFGVIMERVSTFMNVDTSLTANKFIFNEGVGLCAKLAKYMSVEKTASIFEQVLPVMCERILADKDNFDLISEVFYCFSQYLVKHRDAEFAKMENLLIFAKEALDSCAEDGGDSSLHAFDSVCGFLAISGELCG